MKGRQKSTLGCFQNINLLRVVSRELFLLSKVAIRENSGLMAIKTVPELSLSPALAWGAGAINTCRSCSQPGPASRHGTRSAPPISAAHAVTSPARQPTRRRAPFQVFLKVAAGIQVARLCRAAQLKRRR